MKKKILSIILAITLVASMMTVAIVNVSATSDNLTSENKIIHFDVSSAGWETSASAGVYCHIYSVDGTGKWPGWKSKAEKCKYDATTGIATYDIQTGVKKGFTDLETIGPNNEWCIMFCTQSGAETYPILMNSSCFGDTVYVPDQTQIYENNVDSEKKSVAVRWKNHDLGAAKVITSTGKIQGDSFAYGETNETILASYLISYALDADKLKLTQDLVNQLNVSPVDVMSVVIYKQDEAVKSGSKTKEIADKETASIEKTLANCTEPPYLALGDVNGDGDISILDATEIQKYLVSLSKLTEEQKKRADANGDGAVSILDATEIQKYLVGIVSSLG